MRVDDLDSTQFLYVPRIQSEWRKTRITLKWNLFEALRECKLQKGIKNFVWNNFTFFFVQLFCNHDKQEQQNISQKTNLNDDNSER